MSNKNILITGITGMDGSILTEKMLDEGNKVVGIVRRSAAEDKKLYNIENLLDNPNLTLVNGDLTDSSSIFKTVSQYKPDEFYNLGAQSVIEEEYLPVNRAGKISYVTFKELWDTNSTKKQIRKEIFNGTEVEVIDMSDNTQTKAMGYWSGMGTWFKIKQISRHRWNGTVCKLSQKFGSVTVTPNHSILDTQNVVKKPIENPWLLNVRKINFINKEYLDEVMFINDKILTGDKINCLLRFLGAFIAEGHTCYNKANKSYNIGISNNNIEWLKNLQKDLHQFYDGSSWIIEHKKENFDSTYELQLTSKEFYKLIKEWCGDCSYTKKIPDWVFRCDSQHIQELFNKMLEGDGCYTKINQFRYTTASRLLASQISYLITILGKDYTVNEEVSKVYDNVSYWHFRECSGYQPNQGEKRYTEYNYNGWVYDISVDEVTNFAVGVGNIVVHNSHVGASFTSPESTMEINSNGVLNCLEAIRLFSPNTKFYQASTSELYGDCKYAPQNEETPFVPNSPYACAKLAAHNLVGNYRRAYGLHACAGILFNHESERRGEQFVTRKITKAAARIKLGLQNELRLGNLDAKRDWGYAPEYVDGMILILRHHTPDDFVLATGVTNTIRDFVNFVGEVAGFDLMKHVIVDDSFKRPSEVPLLLGDSSKARRVLGWQPKTDVKELARIMYNADLEKETKNVK